MARWSSSDLIVPKRFMILKKQQLPSVHSLPTCCSPKLDGTGLFEWWSAPVGHPLGSFVEQPIYWLFRFCVTSAVRNHPRVSAKRPYYYTPENEWRTEAENIYKVSMFLVLQPLVFAGVTRDDGQTSSFLIHLPASYLSTQTSIHTQKSIHEQPQIPLELDFMYNHQTCCCRPRNTFTDFPLSTSMWEFDPHQRGKGIALPPAIPISPGTAVHLNSRKLTWNP